MIDVLIIDDVQFFSGKSGTQDVFFHIFNHLHQNGKQVILTSDKAPVDMQDIEQRLLSRFKWGLSAELHSPDYETRISILRNKLFRDGVEMPEEIVEYVAKNIKTNVNRIQGERKLMVGVEFSRIQHFVILENVHVLVFRVLDLAAEESNLFFRLRHTTVQEYNNDSKYKGRKGICQVIFFQTIYN